MKSSKLAILLLIPILTLTACGSKDTSKDTTVTVNSSIKAREGSVGVSNKNVKDLDGFFNPEVRNDKTGNWRYFDYNKPEEFTPYVLSYGKGYIKNDEVHYVLDFNNKVLYIITDQGPYYWVRTKEHVDGEEHDASTLGSGMDYKEYKVYKDNGDIVETK